MSAAQEIKTIKTGKIEIRKLDKLETTYVRNCTG
jgi:hypothetical protein